MNPNIMKEMQIDPAPFAELVNKPEELKAVFEVFFTIIMISFRIIDASALGKSTLITKDELKRRFKICEKWFRIMRGDLGYGLQRTLSKLPEAFTCEMTGQDYNPEKEEYAYVSTIEAMKKAFIVEGS